MTDQEKVDANSRAQKEDFIMRKRMENKETALHQVSRIFQMTQNRNTDAEAVIKEAEKIEAWLNKGLE